MELHLGILFILGIGVLGGTIGALLFQKLKIPQVVGYIGIGLLIGDTCLGIIKSDQIGSFEQLNLFALGIIGFLVGGELSGDIFRKYGKQFMGILLGEGLAAFVLVGLASGLVIYMVVHKVAPAVAAGIVFGAIASATDPASTIDVLWEYRSRGILTTAIIAIVALDDALAMTLYGLGTSAASMIMGENASFSAAFMKLGVELFGSIILGGVAGFVLNWVLRHIHHSDKVLPFSLGMLLLVIAFATRKNMDVILATMTMGVVLINAAPQRSKKLFEVVKQFAGPIYVIFFVLVGARLSIGNMPAWLWWIAGLYVFFRTLGKMFGAWVGAKMSHADKVVSKYTGMGLFAQGGVAVGLSIMASQHLGDMHITDTLTLGDVIIFTVTATTLAVQVIGPPAVKLAIKLADEIGRDINEEDILKANKVSDVIDSQPVALQEHAPVAEILKVFSDTAEMVLPVVKPDGRLVGQISLHNLKNLFARTDCWQWLVAADVMQPASDVLRADQTLSDSLELMREIGAEQILVMDAAGEKICGILDSRNVRRWLEKELIRRQTAVAAA